MQALQKQENQGKHTDQHGKENKKISVVGCIFRNHKQGVIRRNDSTRKQYPDGIRQVFDEVHYVCKDQKQNNGSFGKPDGSAFHCKSRQVGQDQAEETADHFEQEGRR